MSDSALALLEDKAWPQSVGFWRRFIAFLIDYLIVFVPLFLVVAMLFASTNGAVTGKFSLKLQICYEAKLNEGGNPFLSQYDWTLCKMSILGLEVASWTTGELRVDESSSSDSSDTVQTMTLPLDTAGNIRTTPLELGFLEFVLLFAYLFISEKVFGRSVGKRCMSIQVHDERDFDRVGLSLRKAFTRQSVKFLGLLPMTLLEIWYSAHQWGSDPGVVEEVSRFQLVLVYSCLGFSVLWVVFICGSIAITREPVHDRFAETSVRIS